MENVFTAQLVYKCYWHQIVFHSTVPKLVSKGKYIILVNLVTSLLQCRLGLVACHRQKSGVLAK